MLRRFYELTKGTTPIAAKRITVRAFFNDYWCLVYAGGYYVIVEKSPDGLVGEHPMVLYYSAGKGNNYAIASAVFEGHLTKGKSQAIHDEVRRLRMTKGFYQSQAAKELQVAF